MEIDKKTGRPVGRLLSLKDIQNLSLSILLDIHNFCIKHNLRYSLAYGTLIGAIRHKGFIPWDDDVDIVMPRKDFEIFCSKYKSDKGFKILSPSSPKSLITFGRVFDSETTRCETTAPWSTFETGVWIDIFPLDGVEDNDTDFNIRLKKISPTAKKLAMIRTSSEGFWKTKTIRRKCTWIIKKILTLGKNIESLKTEYLNNIQSYDFESSNYYGQLGCYDEGTHKEHNPKDDFSHCVEVDFEGHRLLAMNGYDNILHRYYGDYMQLPPVEQQIPKAANYIKFYWK